MNKTVKVDNDSTNVAFMCMASGAISYYWLRENGNINARGNILVLHNVLPSDSDRYQCVAENEHGETYSNYAVFTVEGNR